MIGAELFDEHLDDRQITLRAGQMNSSSLVVIADVDVTQERVDPARERRGDAGAGQHLQSRLATARGFLFQNVGRDDRALGPGSRQTRANSDAEWTAWPHRSTGTRANRSSGTHLLSATSSRYFMSTLSYSTCASFLSLGRG